jgi:hypothetical protein
VVSAQDHFFQSPLTVETFPKPIKNFKRFV